MSDSLSNKELVAVGHHLAKALSSDTPIIDIAKTLSRLAERLDCTTAALREMTKQRDALASYLTARERALTLLEGATPENSWETIARLKVVIGGDYRSQSEIDAAGISIKGE